MQFLTITPGFRESTFPSVAETGTTSLIMKSMRKFFHNDLIEACVKEYKKIDINAKEV